MTKELKAFLGALERELRSVEYSLTAVSTARAVRVILKEAVKRACATVEKAKRPK